MWKDGWDGWGAALAQAQEGAPGKRRGRNRRREAQLWIKPHSSSSASD